MQSKDPDTKPTLTAKEELRVSPNTIRRQALALMPGMEWNPLRTLDRNRPCPCLSERKFKVCCLPTLPVAVTAKQAAEIKIAMSKPDLVFATRENQGKLIGVAKAEIDRIDAERAAQRQEALDDPELKENGGIFRA